MDDDERLNAWWNSLTAQQQAEAMTIPQKLPEWMSTSEKASEILGNWQFGTSESDEFWSAPLREFLERKRNETRQVPPTAE